MLRDEALKGNKLLTNKLINDTVIEPDKNYLYFENVFLVQLHLDEVEMIVNYYF